MLTSWSFTLSVKDKPRDLDEFKENVTDWRVGICVELALPLEGRFALGIGIRSYFS